MKGTSIDALERAAMSAWPALETIEEDGWILRFANGYTRRSNCATALDPAQGSLGGRIAWCERAFAVRSLPPVFRVLSAGGPAGLDDELHRADYARGDEVVVMTLDLAAAPALDGVALPDEMALDPWLDLYDRFGGRFGANRHTHRTLLGAIPGERLLAVIDADGERAGCGLAVREGALVGLFDLGVSPALRGRGHGRRLLDGLLRWGKDRGACRAYLQVLATNPATRLYERAGFREAYRYWYRSRPA